VVFQLLGKYFRHISIQRGSGDDRRVMSFRRKQMLDWPHESERRISARDRRDAITDRRRNNI
jgi:hypothetical protein